MPFLADSKFNYGEFGIVPVQSQNYEHVSSKIPSSILFTAGTDINSHKLCDNRRHKGPFGQQTRPTVTFNVRKPRCSCNPDQSTVTYLPLQPISNYPPNPQNFKSVDYFVCCGGPPRSLRFANSKLNINPHFFAPTVSAFHFLMKSANIDAVPSFFIIRLSPLVWDQKKIYILNTHINSGVYIILI